MKKDQADRRKMKLMLLMLRCEFLSGVTLTKKGKGWLKPWMWRLYNDILCKLSKKHNKEVVDLLGSFISKQEQ